jgi:S1-C subfamily serine protease
LACGLSFCLAEATAGAEPPSLGASTDVSAGPALGFSNLLVRLEHEDEIKIAGADLRVHILEALRTAGFNAVGAENLVFGQDRSNQADYLLGGTVRELECLNLQLVLEVSCRVGIEWQVLDVRRQAVVYKVVTRAAQLNVARANPNMAKNLVLGALESLARRPSFRALVAKESRPSSPPSAPAYPAASLRRCPTGPREMPASAEQVLGATVLVQSRDGFGSGFVITPDGLALTAAHVVTSGEFTVRTRAGSVLKAKLLRRATDVDAALIQVLAPEGTSSSCLGLNLEAKTIGTEVYAIGSPASEKLAFSLTRGIVSGLRDFDGQKYLQTDASISPGNSGGPLVDRQGRAAAIVSWKVAARSIEGVAFGVPVEDALRSLSVTMGAETSAALLRAPALDPQRDPASKPVVDTDDAVPSLDPERDRAIAMAKWAREQRARSGGPPSALADEGESATAPGVTPGYVTTLRLISGFVFTAGAVGVAYSYAKFDDHITRADYESLRTLNDWSWIAVGAGAAAFGVSYLLPKAPAKQSVRRSDGSPTATFLLAPNGARLMVGF